MTKSKRASHKVPRKAAGARPRHPAVKTEGGRPGALADEAGGLPSAWPTDLRAALAGNRIRAAYQPILMLHDSTVVAEEALARLISVDGAVTPAATFIEAAAACELIAAIDAAVLNQTLARCTARRAQGLPERLHFVNISQALLSAPHQLAAVAAAVDVCGTPWTNDDPRWRSLVLEITERELITDPAGVITALAPLLDAGVRLALDDFGSGYSSFLYLADLPIAFLKIEQTLIARVGGDRRVDIMVEAMARMAADLNIITIAEGIESAATAASVAALGVRWGQGYHFGRPGWE